MHRFIVFILPILLYSCGGKSPKGSQGTNIVFADTLNIRMEKEDYCNNWLSAYYLLDENWTLDHDPVVLQEWMDEKIATLKRKCPSRSVLGHGNSGGGPRGTQWNPFASLLCVGKITPRPDDKNVNFNVFINDVKISADVKSDTAANNALLFYFVIPSKVWNSYMKQMQEKDMQLVYADNEKVLLDWKHLQETGDSVDIGIPFVFGSFFTLKVVANTSSGAKTELNAIFHGSYGE